jgi:YD repeat-containing protein
LASSAAFNELFASPRNSYDPGGNQIGVVDPSSNRTTTTWDLENRPIRMQLLSGLENQFEVRVDTGLLLFFIEKNYWNTIAPGLRYIFLKVFNGRRV